VNKKKHEVGEAAAPYAAKKPEKAAASHPTKSGQSKTSDAAFKNATDKIFSERKELLH
jgi:hypothetical protein